MKVFWSKPSLPSSVQGLLVVSDRSDRITSPQPTDSARSGCPEGMNTIFKAGSASASVSQRFRRAMREGDASKAVRRRTRKRPGGLKACSACAKRQTRHYMSSLRPQLITLSLSARVVAIGGYAVRQSRQCEVVALQAAPSARIAEESSAASSHTTRIHHERRRRCPCIRAWRSPP